MYIFFIYNTHECSMTGGRGPVNVNMLSTHIMCFPTHSNKVNVIPLKATLKLILLIGLFFMISLNVWLAFQI